MKLAEKILRLMCVACGIFCLMVVFKEWDSINWFFRVLMVFLSVVCFSEG